jgi:hypothetical protein
METVQKELNQVGKMQMVIKETMDCEIKLQRNLMNMFGGKEYTDEW